ncbi:glycosyltransferase family 4 protein [Pusillimonas caeni]|uniref:glycosyltransferase family 4 protein n=1 Tax=Pusillimonas caeni TaxID=1348472 RepID=UPI001FD769CB|nr:glycosyltransferase family 4 protein [Pusillimonas caeni]
MVIRNFLLAREWVRQGHSVTIVASDFSHYRALQPEHSRWQTTEYIEGVRFIWLRGLRYKASSSIGRVFAMAWFTTQCYCHRLFDRDLYDVIIASSPHPFVIYPAAFLAKLQKAYLIYDIRDLWPLTPMHLGGHSTKHPFMRALQHAEDYACRYADLVIAVQDNVEEYLIEHGLEKRRYLHVPNGYSEDNTPAQPLPERIIEALKIARREKAFIVGYCGTLGTANAMSLIIEALGHVDPRIYIAIVGEGPDKTKLKKMAHDLGVAERALFFDAIPKAAVSSFLKEVDATYVGGHSSPLYRYGASLTKLNDYLMARKPVIYGLGDPNNVVRVCGAGIEYIPGSVCSLVEALNKMLSLSDEQRDIMGEKGQAWLKANRQMSVIAARVLMKLRHLGKRTIVK